jgi:hypothetical protein
MSIDKKFLSLRESKYNKTECTHKMVLKHFQKKCNCIKTGKKCIGYLGKGEHILNFSRLGDPTYIGEIIYLIDALYHVNMSVTQGLRTKTGRDFEDCFRIIMEEEGFQESKHFDSQIYITQDSKIMTKKKPSEKAHTVDFIIPVPDKYPCKLDDYKGDIISCKTSLACGRTCCSVGHLFLPYPNLIKSRSLISISSAAPLLGYFCNIQSTSVSPVASIRHLSLSFT